MRNIPRLDNIDWGNKPAPPAPPTRTQQKELIVFMVSINFGSSSPMKTREQMAHINSTLQSTFADVEEKTNYLVKVILMEVKDQPTKIECIFPVSNIPEISNKLKFEMENFISSDGTDNDTFIRL